VSLRTYRVAERRRNVLLSLASATVLAVLLALLTGSVVLWLAFFVAASLLGAYMYVLAQIRAAAAARRPVLQNVYVLDDHRRDDSIGDDRIAL
jgi:type IV secretory pathway TrbD component